MTMFTLVVRPDGKALLCARQPLGENYLRELNAMLTDWLQGPHALAVLAETEVVQVSEIDIDLEARTVRIPVPVTAAPAPRVNAIGGPQMETPRGVTG